MSNREVRSNEQGRFAEAGRFCITDVGSTTTKAILFKRDGDWHFWYEEVPTTVEKPDEDVTVGVLQALQALERASGEKLVHDNRPCVPYLSTSSAGGGLALVVTGLVKEITAESADRVALGAGAIVLDTLAMNDGRSPYRKIEDLKTLRPDMVLLAGGFDGDALTGPVFMAELLLESGLHPKLNPAAQLPVVYAGNARATDYVRRALDERFLVQVVPNVRPAGDREVFEPARAAIHRLFMDHVMSQAPGYEVLKHWVSAPIRPTPAAFAGILALVSREMQTGILAVDIGGATTDVFTAQGGRVLRTVSANLGLSYSILHTAEVAGPTAVRSLLDTPPSPTEFWNRVGEKYVNPTQLPVTPDDMRLEWAIASVAIREAVKAHFAVIHASAAHLTSEPGDINDLLRDPPAPLLPREDHVLGDFGLIIGSGGILSHSPRDAAARILVDALDPGGQTELAVDSTFMFPHLGMLGEVAPELAQELFFKLGMVRLGTARDVRRQDWGAARDYVPKPHATATRETEHVGSGPIALWRELAIPGDVLVKRGDRVEPGTVVARSHRLFLRPFFLPVAEAIHVAPDELPRYLHKNVGDEVKYDDVIASRPRRLMPDLKFRSPVAGRVEKLLPAGVLLIRERPEAAREVTVVNAARELDLEPKRLAPYVKVEVGQEVEAGEWLVSMLPNVMKVCRSPVRGRVSRIDLKEGTIRIDPLLEEKEVRAWLPGVVEASSKQGCRVAGSGRTIQGVWGNGGEAFGELRIAECGLRNGGTGLRVGDCPRGSIAVCDFADHDGLQRVRESGLAGVIAGGVNLEDVRQPQLGFTLVVLEGFGERVIRPEFRQALAAHEGRLALVDGTTQMRVGVRRPVVILPDGTV